MAILGFFPNRQVARVRQTQLGAIVALESAQKMAQLEIDRIKQDVIWALLDKAQTESGMYMAELKTVILEGQLVQQLLIS